ncbi:unnamed protein product [Phaeothamnion confervicola]
MLGTFLSYVEARGASDDAAASCAKTTKRPCKRLLGTGVSWFCHGLPSKHRFVGAAVVAIVLLTVARAGSLLLTWSANEGRTMTPSRSAALGGSNSARDRGGDRRPSQLPPPPPPPPIAGVLEQSPWVMWGAGTGSASRASTGETVVCPLGDDDDGKQDSMEDLRRRALPWPFLPSFAEAPGGENRTPPAIATAGGALWAARLAAARAAAAVATAIPLPSAPSGNEARGGKATTGDDSGRPHEPSGFQLAPSAAAAAAAAAAATKRTEPSPLIGWEASMTGISELATFRAMVAAAHARFKAYSDGLGGGDQTLAERAGPVVAAFAWRIVESVQAAGVAAWDDPGLGGKAWRATAGTAATLLGWQLEGPARASCMQRLGRRGVAAGDCACMRDGPTVLCLAVDDDPVNEL